MNRMSIANERKHKLAKVRINEYGIIILDGKMNGKRHRLTTGKKADKRLLKWYESHIEDEFFKLYEDKFGSIHQKMMTFSEYGQHILEISDGNRNMFSQKEVLQQFKTLCNTFGEMEMDKIKASYILKWQKECGFAPKTIKNYRGTLNIIFKMAYADDLMTKNPLQTIKAPKVIKGTVEVFEQDEMKALLKNATGQLKNILQFNFFAGLRGSELIALRWNDIDFDNNTILIDKRIREGNVDTTKSKVARTIDMLPQAKKALKQQWESTGSKDGHIFLTQRGNVFVKPSNISEAIKILCVKSNVKIGTLHTVRRSCNTLLKQYGLPLDWILDQLGHIEDVVNRAHYTGKIRPNLSKIGRVLAEC